MKFCCKFFFAFRPSLFAFVNSIDVNLTSLPQHSVCQAKKITVEKLQIQKFMILYAFLLIKSCQNQNLCLQSFNSNGDKEFRKDLQSIIASIMTILGTQAQIL